MTASSASTAFFQLTPDLVLDSVEAALGRTSRGRRATGRTWALNSLENRVYEIEFEDGEHCVAKFYRPLRWAAEQIIEEHLFVHALKYHEIPVVPPFELVESSGIEIAKFKEAPPVLGRMKNGILFSVYPKVTGRLCDELKPVQFEALGRYLARLHNVGETLSCEHRLTLDVETYGTRSLQVVERSAAIRSDWKARYTSVALQALERVRAVFKDFYSIPVHGDCHVGNILWNENAPFILDFDDMVIAPPVQDIWMIVAGRGEVAQRDREILLSAYEEFRPFQRNSLVLIEPLRALRMIRYSAWIAERWEDPTFKNVFPQFVDDRYWSEEIQSLLEVIEIVDHGGIIQ